MFRNMLIVDKFLCFTLETGGLVISWFLMSVFIIVDLILNYSLVRTLIECKNGNHTKQSSNDGASDGHDENIESCFQTTSTVIFALLSLFGLVLIIFCILSIKGTKGRNYRLIQPLMISEGVITVGSIISIASNPLYGIVLFILNAYMFIVLYSLFLQFKEEHRRPQIFDLPTVDTKERF